MLQGVPAINRDNVFLVVGCGDKKVKMSLHRSEGIKSDLSLKLCQSCSYYSIIFGYLVIWSEKANKIVASSLSCMLLTT